MKLDGDSDKKITLSADYKIKAKINLTGYEIVCGDYCLMFDGDVTGGTFTGSHLEYLKVQSKSITFDGTKISGDGQKCLVNTGYSGEAVTFKNVTIDAADSVYALYAYHSSLVFSGTTKIDGIVAYDATTSTTLVVKDTASIGGLAFPASDGNNASYTINADMIASTATVGQFIMGYAYGETNWPSHPTNALIFDFQTTVKGLTSIMVTSPSTIKGTLEVSNGITLTPTDKANTKVTLALDTATLKGDVDFTVKDQTLTIGNGSTYTGTVSFTDSNGKTSTADITGLKAGSKGVVLKASSIGISGDVDTSTSGVIKVTGEAKVIWGR